MSNPSADRPSILVVEDDSQSRKLLCRALEAAGFLACEASNGHDALSKIHESQPDVVILDLQMPGLNGAETCALLRAESNPAISELPVIMLTAHDDEEAEVHCLEAGANDFLAKPVGRASLKARIQTQLRMRAMSVELRTKNDELERWNAHHLADLEAAKITQRAIIPTKPPASPGWEIESHYAPVIQVGGDIYGWRRFDDGGFVVWMADATGHGASAALLTTLVAHLFQQATSLSRDPGAVLLDVNAELLSQFRGKSFMSACCAIFTSDGTVTVSSAGHPPLILSRGDHSVEAIEAHSTMIGITQDLTTSNSTFQMSQGDTLLVFTDGLHSLRLPSGDRMGDGTVLEVFSEASSGAFAGLPELVECISSKSNGDPFDDDVTVIAIRRTGL